VVAVYDAKRAARRIIPQPIPFAPQAFRDVRRAGCVPKVIGHGLIGGGARTAKLGSVFLMVAIAGIDVSEAASRQQIL
jgi:hypothetical protein